MNYASRLLCWAAIVFPPIGSPLVLSEPRLDVHCGTFLKSDTMKIIPCPGKVPQSSADLSPTYESEEKKYAAEEKFVAEDVKPVQSNISQDMVDAFMRDTEAPFDEKFKKAMSQDLPEKVPEEYSGKEVVQEEFTRTIVESVREEPTVETVTTTVVKDGEKITKTIVKESKVESMDEPPSFSKDDIPEKDVTTTVTKQTFDDGSHSIITTKTTERRSFIVDDDDADAVKEKIVIEQRKDAHEFNEQQKKISPTDVSSKSDMLQKLGEELGKLDDRLEETFKEKRKAAPSHEGKTP